MEEKCKPKFPKMSFKVMNALNMKEIQTGSFNTVIDKGKLDSVLYGDNSVANAPKIFSEVFRVLAPGGHYICITYGDLEQRKKHFETHQWGNISVDKIPKPTAGASSANNGDENDLKNFHYIYTMTKQK